MNENKPYDGKKVDIFCLGEALMILVTGIPGFELATRNNQYYQQICRKKYWALLEDCRTTVKAKGYNIITRI